MSSTNPASEPRYQVLRRSIQRRIRRGEWASGDRIPGERELAREAGVSQMTVNRAILDLVRAGVLIRRVGSGTYVTDHANEARTAAAIEVVTRYTGHPEEDLYLRTPFAAIRAVASREGCRVEVSQAAEPELAALADSHPERGLLILAPCADSCGLLSELHETGVPLVVMGASWEDAPFPCVDSDNAGGVQTAVSYLARLGHTRIAFIDADATSANCRDRRRGYAAGLALNGLEAHPDWTVQAVSAWELGADATRQVTELLVGPGHVSAVLCAGYLITLALFSLLQQLRMRVPEDVSVVGFDDPPSAEHLSPPLTTIRQPLHALGDRAAQRLLGLIRSPEGDNGGVERLPVDLVVRASCRRL